MVLDDVLLGCNLLGRYRRFGDIYYLNFSAKTDDMFLGIDIIHLGVHNS
jgi:hypothetical protein